MYHLILYILRWNIHFHVSVPVFRSRFRSCAQSPNLDEPFYRSISYLGRDKGRAWEKLRMNEKDNKWEKKREINCVHFCLLNLKAWLYISGINSISGTRCFQVHVTMSNNFFRAFFSFISVRSEFIPIIIQRSLLNASNILFCFLLNSIFFFVETRKNLTAIGIFTRHLNAFNFSSSYFSSTSLLFFSR